MEFIRKLDKIYTENDEGIVVAEVTFPLTSEGVVSINHTYVDESLRGQGVANALLEEAYDLLREKGLKAEPVCSFAVKWFQDHPEKSDIIIEK